MGVRVYDLADVISRIDGNVITGYADGTAIEVQKLEDNFTSKATADGGTVVSENNDNRGLITLTLDQTSPSIAVLNRLANSKRMYPARVIDTSSRKQKAGGSKARVRKPADASWGRESGDQTFEIEVFDFKME
ncbi:phage structural protein [Desertibacillus haloalkaliphilus]|uniref:phage structural protein n=1 Tax=Desertibacillus haloalkaliphilus TaxID=1328930 RepID=UPI001C2569EB|nr:phage protein [Desertibacillus haloalkaliphilus]MBU8908504.1 DUF3277 family protein [Desertibacillus haloalkaliphilus]